MKINTTVRVLSIGLGILLLFHGVDKIFNGVDSIIPMLKAQHVPYAEYLVYGVYIGEFVAPLLLIFGQYVRIAGMIIVFNMLVAIILAHSNEIFTMTAYGAWSLEIPMLYLVGGLSLALLDEPLTK